MISDIAEIFLLQEDQVQVLKVIPGSTPDVKMAVVEAEMANGKCKFLAIQHGKRKAHNMTLLSSDLIPESISKSIPELRAYFPPAINLKKWVQTSKGYRIIA